MRTEPLLKIDFWVITLCLLTTFLCLSSCQEEKEEFDSVKWKRNGGARITLGEREKMVDDLIESKLLIGKNQKEIESLLESPSRPHLKNNENYKYYIVNEVYEWGDIDPVELIYLKVRFNDLGVADTVTLYNTK